MNKFSIKVKNNLRLFSLSSLKCFSREVFRNKLYFAKPLKNIHQNRFLAKNCIYSKNCVYQLEILNLLELNNK